MTSKFASREIYLLENRNSISRIRDKKRKTYMEFLSWLDNTNPIDLRQSTDACKVAFKSVHILRAMECFPVFMEKLNKELDLYEDKKLYSSLVNGDVVKSITSLDGKELGQFIQLFKAMYSCEQIIDMSHSEVKSLIEVTFIDWSNANA